MDSGRRFRDQAFEETDTWFRYDKKFAYLPVTSGSGEQIWMKNYYKVFQIYSYRYGADIFYFIGNLTVEDTIIEKLRNS